ncbi:hypothetical protein CHARACLAT_018246, partial [Characodon lateralis]|nr:hypothetical protein [Characodon lateralis]
LQLIPRRIWISRQSDFSLLDASSLTVWITSSSGFCASPPQTEKLLQGKTIPKLGSLDQIETGSGDSEGHYSGDCDDEDGCAGSGGSEINKKVSKICLWRLQGSQGHPNTPFYPRKCFVFNLSASREASAT